jgi:hypothetical protein
MIKKYVDKIITEKHGLDKKIEFNISGFNEGPMWFNQGDNKNANIFSSSLNTPGNLFNYIFIKEKNGKVKLPNDIECDIVELIDYITISYLHTHGLLQNHKIFVFDMHLDNIFVHWLNENSYLGNENIGNIENIIYKVDKKAYKIKTFGFIIKLGDLGTSIITPRKDIVICGMANNMDKNYKIAEQRIKPNHHVTNFIMWNIKTLPLFILKKTVADEIINSYPYDKLSYIKSHIDYNDLKQFLTPFELLKKFFSKYETRKIIEDKKTFIVDK